VAHLAIYKRRQVGGDLCCGDGISGAALAPHALVGAAALLVTTMMCGCVSGGVISLTEDASASKSCR
jgi:hypothetical protein